MNTRNIASFAAAVALTAAASVNASAGELYGALDNAARGGSSHSTMTAPMQSFTTGLANDGVLYSSADAALDAPSAASAQMQIYNTSLAVGGELGYPADRTRPVTGGIVVPTALAE